MKMWIKNILPSLIFVVVGSCLGFWFSKEINLKNRIPDTEGEGQRGSYHSSRSEVVTSNRRTRPPKTNDETRLSALSVSGLLNELYKSNASFGSKVEIRLFDDQLNPVNKSTELLGIDDEVLNDLSNYLKEAKLNLEDLETISEVSNANDQRTFKVEVESDEAKLSWLNEIRKRFRESFPEEMADSLLNEFVRNHPLAFGGITDFERTITINKSGQEYLVKTQLSRPDSSFGSTIKLDYFAKESPELQRFLEFSSEVD